ncbi:MAG: 23S rRNA (uracil(1939)-C(5))-methyltransferase RlmD [Clostridiales bacterium]|nr:23S rRNA (uracil(1939)-C(5))-methyltransferase RlmD [Clostridiales bacterium]
MILQKNQIITAFIEDMNALGHGVSRIEGFVVFVRGGVTGDELKIKMIKVLKNYAIAIIEEIISPSPYRIKHPCAVSTACGGCAFSHIDYQYEKELKQKFVQAEFTKAGLSYMVVHPVISGSSCEGYRNKVQLPLTSDYRFGYYAPKSHRIVPCADGCRLHPAIFDQIAQTVCTFAKEHQISVYDEATGLGLLRHLYVRIGKETGEIMVCLVINGTSLPHQEQLVSQLLAEYHDIQTILLNINQKNTNVILGAQNKILYGSGHITDRLCGNLFEISPHSFYQINHDTAELLYQKALQLAEIEKADKAADLYCGIGTIAITAAKSAPNTQIIGVEIVPDAIENAKKNAKRNHIDNVSFYQGDANDPRIADCQVIIVDPPRKGLSEALIQTLHKNAPDKIVYISCAPDTLARDCRRLFDAGYHACEVFPFDMFPRTGHVECVVLLSKVKEKLD